MGTIKEQAYSEERKALAKLIKAIAHPARLTILDYLLRQKSCVCGDIVEELDLAQPTVSQHLKELKSVGLIKGTVEGRNICYCIDPNTYSKLRSELLGLLQPLEQGNSNCC